MSEQSLSCEVLWVSSIPQSQLQNGCFDGAAPIIAVVRTAAGPDTEPLTSSGLLLNDDEVKIYLKQCIFVFGRHLLLHVNAQNVVVGSSNPILRTPSEFDEEWELLGEKAVWA